MEVASGIHRVEGMRIGNVYVVLRDQDALVIDTGMPGGAGRILEYVERLGRRPADVACIVLTHWHPDHMGSAAELRRRTGGQIAIHELDAPALAGQDRPAKGRRAMSVLFRALRIRPIVADVTLRAGDRIGGFDVIHVPGHTAGSIALQRDDGVVFSGDALLADRRGRPRYPDPGLSIDPAQGEASAAALLALEPRLLLPGHGGPLSSPDASWEIVK